MRRAALAWVISALGGFLCACFSSGAQPGSTIASGIGEPPKPSVAGLLNPAAASRPATQPTTTGESPQQIEQKARRIAELNRELLRLFRAGKYDQCRAQIDRILQIDPDNEVAWYNLACVSSRQKKVDEALKCLNKAIDCGYSDLRHMERDEDLDAIRATRGYKDILSRKDEIQRRRADKILQQLKDRFGEGYICEIDHENKLVFATNVDRQTLEELKRHLTRYAEAQWKNLFTTHFDQYLTVVVPRPGGALTQPAIGGYYAHAFRLLVARTVGMTLTHEFTHALHAADQEGLHQEHPIWVTEGLATLFESCKIKDGNATPEPNRRLNYLKRLVARKQTVPWEKFVRWNHGDFMQQAIVAYPQCRYMLMYVYEKGLLKQWYDAYAAGYEADPTGIKALEKVFDKKVAQIEADWKKWVAELPAPPLQFAANHAYVGVRVSAVVDGLRIVQIVPGSAADKAGLKVGDVISGIDDERVVDPDDLLLLVDAHKVGDELQIQYRRDGQYATVAVELLPMPATLPRLEEPQPKTRPATRPASAPVLAPAPRKKAA